MISFGAIMDRTFGDADFGINATATSGLPVSFSPSGNCTVTSPSPGTVHLTSAGSCIITGSQNGDSNFNAAANVPQSFSIAKAATTTLVSTAITVECGKGRPGAEAQVSGSLEGTGGSASLSLPLSWLNRVSGRGLAVVDGHFVLEVDQPAPATALSGRAVRWERRPGGASAPVAAPCTIRRWPEGWELRWDA